MSGVTGVAVGAAVVGAGASVYAANKSASASKSATRSAIGEQQREYDQAREDQAPYRALGAEAIGDIRRLYGRADNTDGVVTGGGSPDFSGFFKSPDYQFNLTEGQQAIDRSAAAHGGLLSGAAVKAGTRFASNLASGEFSNYYNRLASQAGLGQTGVQAATQAGMNAANQNTGAYLQNGQQQGQSAYLAAGGINQAVQGGAGDYLLSKYLGTTPNNTGLFSSWASGSQANSALSDAGFGGSNWTPQGGW